MFINFPDSWINKINDVHLEAALHDDGLAGLAAAIEPGSRNRIGPLLLFYDSDQLVLADPYSSVRVQHLSKHNHLFYSIKIEGPENRTHKESVWFLLCGDLVVDEVAESQRTNGGGLIYSELCVWVKWSGKSSILTCWTQWRRKPTLELKRLSISTYRIPSFIILFYKNMNYLF